jgi:hypothetical protein
MGEGSVCRDVRQFLMSRWGMGAFPSITCLVCDEQLLAGQQYNSACHTLSQRRVHVLSARVAKAIPAGQPSSRVNIGRLARRRTA